MNKILTFLFILVINNCNAATGNASDGQLMAAIIIAMMMLVVGTGFLIGFMKNKIKEYKTRKLIRKDSPDQNREFLNSLIKPIQETERLSVY